MIRTANLTWSVSRKAGGLFESVRRLVQSLDRTGIEVCVFGVRDEFTDADIGAWNPVHVLAFKPTWPEQFGYSPGFLQELADFKPDVTHTHGIWVYPSVATNLYGNKTKCPYMISAHGMLDPWAVHHSRWKKLIAHWLYEGAHLRSARCLRALCEPEAKAIRALGLKNEIVIIPNGIDLPVRRPSGPAPWHDVIAQGSKVLLFLSRIHPKKGLVNLLKAWAAIRNSACAGSEPDEWVLVIAGWDQAGHEDELKRLATDLQIPWTDLRDSPPPGNSHPPVNGLAHHTVREAGLVGEAGPVRHSLSEGGRSFSEGGPVRHSFSEGGPVRHSFSEGRPVRHSLSEGGPVRHSLSEGGSQVPGPRSQVPGPTSVVFLGPQFDDAKSACYAHSDAFILPSFSEGVPMVVLEAWAHAKPVLITPQCNLPQAFSKAAALHIEPTVESIQRGLLELMRMNSTHLAAMGQRGYALAESEFSWPRIAGQIRETYEWMLGGGPPPRCVVSA